MLAAGSTVDPCEILLPPAGHWLVTNVVYTPAGPDFYGYPYDFDTNYLNIIVANWAITNTLVDGLPLAASNFVAIGNSGYSGARIGITNGTHTVTSSQPVGVEVYGFGGDTSIDGHGYDAYGYFGGLVR